MRKSAWLLPILLFCATIAIAQSRKTLDIYVVDAVGEGAGTRTNYCKGYLVGLRFDEIVNPGKMVGHGVAGA